jgi:hypothetical protein
MAARRNWEASLIDRPPSASANEHPRTRPTWQSDFPSLVSDIPKVRASPTSHSEVLVVRPCHADGSRETSLSRSLAESLASAFLTCIYVGARSTHAQILLFLFPGKQDRVTPVNYDRGGGRVAQRMNHELVELRHEIEKEVRRRGLELFCSDPRRFRPLGPFEPEKWMRTRIPDRWALAQDLDY